ncbi:transglycosylase domain-containing protein [Zhihengliuella salsuginis]|uniref:Carboxypeptidase n=1 Tax=Zhihengliuella salsuginis TaxID=578222 RepID=A0ABQ3GE63_9MICC|nr:transglycosylase domain-containing protein [Zhihengliuella salsuginis]GHD02833.1 carboxypeptidase [Zhihengliuella salsuginis]
MFDTATTLGKIVAFFGVSAICGVLAAGLLVPIASLAGSSANASIEFFEELPEELRKDPLSVPSTVLANDGTTLATFFAENRQPVSIDKISQPMQDAIVSIEDERFYEHGGVDLRGTLRAVVSNFTSSSQQGASTLTMQYVNNQIINSGVLAGIPAEELTISGTKDYGDKLREMKLAIAVEKEMSKAEILEGYLNLVLFSGRNYGVEAAAQRFFSKPAAELNIPESAMLAGMVQIPNVYNPLTNPELTQKRRDTVLAAMLRNSTITQEEYDDAVATDLESMLKPSNTSSGCIASSTAPHFCDYVTHQILSNPAYGETVEARENLLYRGGLKIQTTLDPKAQKKALEAARKAVPADDSSNLGSSIVSVEPGTGKILAMAQNKEYGPQDDSSHTVYNFNVAREDGGSNGFQGGSTMKPFTTIAWLQSGHNMWDRVDASRDGYPDSYRWKASCLTKGYTQTVTEDGVWDVNNFTRGYKRPMTVEYGLYWSINTATVAQAAQVDLCDIANAADAVGIVDQDSRDEETGEARPINPANPAMVLGSAKVTPLSQAAGFAAFANNGEFCEPRALVSVTDSSGNSYKVPEQECRQALNTNVVRNLNGTLSKIASKRVAKGTISSPVAGKTGTSNGAASTWFVGYTTGISTAAWVGRHDGNADVFGLEVNGVTPENPDSSSWAAPMWLDYMTDVIPNYEADEFGSADSKPAPPPAPEPEPEDSGSDDNEGSGSDDESESESSSEDDSSGDTGEDEGSESSSAPASDSTGDAGSGNTDTQPGGQGAGNGSNGNGNGNGNSDD